ncbi:MAG: hypothetical protein ACI9N3_002706 [Colwellia sp.]|jgi:hypothetical protein
MEYLFFNANGVTECTLSILNKVSRLIADDQDLVGVPSFSKNCKSPPQSGCQSTVKPKT